MRIFVVVTYSTKTGEIAGEGAEEFVFSFSHGGGFGGTTTTKSY